MIKMFKPGAVGVSLLLLSGCCTTPEPVTRTVIKTVYQKIVPPENLTQPCPLPPAVLDVNEDLAKDNLALMAALADCNNSKHLIRRWADEPES